MCRLARQVVPCRLVSLEGLPPGGLFGQELMTPPYYYRAQ